MIDHAIFIDHLPDIAINKAESLSCLQKIHINPLPKLVFLLSFKRCCYAECLYSVPDVGKGQPSGYLRAAPLIDSGQWQKAPLTMIYKSFQGLATLTTDESDVVPDPLR